MSDWLQYRLDDLRKRLNKIRSKDTLTIIQPYFRLDSHIDGAEVLYADDTHLARNADFECDVFFGQGNQIDIGKLLAVKKTGRATLCAAWFWDNHHLYQESMHIAMLTDIFFPGHHYSSHYLKNEVSLDGGFVPMSSIAWTRQEVERAAGEALLAPRSNSLYGGYNSYAQFAHRDRLIEEVVAKVEDSVVFITEHGTPPERHRYNRLSPQERLSEWMRYKVCLCVSVDRDITMRMFDALLTGSIPLLIGRPDDLDQVISRDMQTLLPIIVVDSKDPEEAAAAYRSCVSAFDQGGPDGVLMRHCFARDNHMPKNRLTQMIGQVRMLAENGDRLQDFLST